MGGTESHTWRPAEDGQLPILCSCRSAAPLELIDGDLVGSMPVESVSHCKYRFCVNGQLLTLFKCKLGAPVESET